MRPAKTRIRSAHVVSSCPRLHCLSEGELVEFRQRGWVLLGTLQRMRDDLIVDPERRFAICRHPHSVGEAAELVRSERQGSR
jgi:hypothetical protein